MAESIDIIHPNHIAATWPLVEPMLSKAMAKAKGEYTLEQMKVNLVSGQDTFMVFVSDSKIVAGLIIGWENYPNDRVAFMKALGGKTTQTHAEQMFNWMRSQGATSVRGAAFESVARLWRMKYGFQEIYKIVEKRL